MYEYKEFSCLKWSNPACLAIQFIQERKYHHNGMTEIPDRTVARLSIHHSGRRGHMMTIRSPGFIPSHSKLLDILNIRTISAINDTMLWRGWERGRAQSTSHQIDTYRHDSSCIWWKVNFFSKPWSSTHQSAKPSGFYRIIIKVTFCLIL